jgi:predicted enzyme related to lactoylglutathione lyase
MPCWAELTTADPAGAAGFYRDLFGWRYQPDEGVFRLDGLAVAGMATGPAPAAWLTYFASADLDALVGLATDTGGQVRHRAVHAGRGRAAVLTDPAGATFGAWQRAGFAGAQLGSQPGTVCWSELAVPDTEAATAFYGKLFGWSTQPGIEGGSGWNYTELLLIDRLVGPVYQVPERVPAHWRTTVEVADVDRVAEVATEAGGRVALDPIKLSIGRYAQLVDPYGARFGVVQLADELRALDI